MIQKYRQFMCVVVVCSALREALTCSSREVQTLATVLEEVEDWEKLACRLDISRDIINNIKMFCILSTTVTECQRRLLVEAYCDKLSSGSHRVALDIAHILDNEMEQNRQAQILRRLFPTLCQYQNKDCFSPQTPAVSESLYTVSTPITGESTSVAARFQTELVSTIENGVIYWVLSSVIIAASIVLFITKLRQRHADLHKTPMAQLKRYIRNTTPTGKELGSGAYGSVIELTSAGETLAGKVFRMSSSVNLQAIRNRVYGELITMVRLHHPNIVQCKGVSLLTDQPLPVLLMERLMSSLHAYLLHPDNSNLSVERKVSILHDTASGLDYLHSQTPAIIHRDLTAKNVLLDSQLRAKIADFGNSRIMDLDPEATPETLTTLPGTLEYMPPEAQGGSVAYDPSLDVFSFGHLSLFTVTQTPVRPLLPPSYCDANGLHACSELNRRARFVEAAEQLLPKNHSLVAVIKCCLHNKPAQRPHTRKLLTRLQRMIPVQRQQQRAPQKLSLEDDITVQDLLKDLLKEELKTLFRKLGLSPSRVENKYDKDLDVYRNDLVRSWILEDDKVKEKGGATWKNLRYVLRSMDKIGIADNIPT